MNTFTDAEEYMALLEGRDALRYRAEKVYGIAGLSDDDYATAELWKQYAAVLDEMAGTYAVAK